MDRTFAIGDKVDCWSVDRTPEEYGEPPEARFQYTATVVAVDGMPGAVCINAPGFCGWRVTRSITRHGEKPTGMRVIRK